LDTNVIKIIEFFKEIQKIDGDYTSCTDETGIGNTFEWREIGLM
jgi:hypothetical protein